MKRQNKFKNLLFFFIPFIIFILMLLAFYPGIMSYDSFVQWEQVQSGVINNAHPFLTTYIMFLLSKIWNNSVVVLIFQILVFALIWYTVVNYLKQDYKKNIIYTVIICLLPIIYLYSITLWKDIIYSYILLLLSFYLFKGARENFNYKKLELVIIGFLIALATLYRHNAIVVTVLLTIIITTIFIKKKINYKKILLFLLVILVSYSTLNLPKKLLYTPEAESENETLKIVDSYTLFILNTYYNNNVKFEEKDLKVLHSIASKETWVSTYDPYLINTFIQSGGVDISFVNNNITTIRKILIKYSIRNPHKFLLHYLKVTSMLYNPLPFGSLYVFEFGEWNPNYGFYSNTNSKIPWLRDIMTSEVRITYGFPYILRVLMYRPAYPFYLSIILMVILVKKKLLEKECYVVLLPMLLNTLSLIPFALAQDLRYVYINFLACALVGLIFINYYKKDKRVKANKNNI